jgi:hypothetical protein
VIGESAEKGLRQAPPPPRLDEGHSENARPMVYATALFRHTEMQVSNFAQTTLVCPDNFPLQNGEVPYERVSYSGG